MNAIQFFRCGYHQCDITISFGDNATYSKFRNFSPRRIFFTIFPVGGGTLTRIPICSVINFKENPYKWFPTSKRHLRDNFKRTDAVLKKIEIEGLFDTFTKMTVSDWDAGIFLNKKLLFKANADILLPKLNYSEFNVINENTLEITFHDFTGESILTKNLNNSILEIVIPKVK